MDSAVRRIDGNLYADFAVSAGADIWSMGVVGKEYGDLSRGDVQLCHCGVAEKFYVFFRIVAATVPEFVAIGPTYCFGSLQRYVDIDVSAMRFQSGFIACNHGRFLELGIDSGLTVDVCNSCNKVIVKMFGKPF